MSENNGHRPTQLPGNKPDYKAPNPKEHPFVPYEPGSSACRWCAFAMHAHLEVAEGVELHPKDRVQRAESG